jgi:DNA-directed RNA polymerase specialized sigma24 family protein
MDDEAILADLDSEPERFALFYRRHVAALLDYFLDRTHDPRLAVDLCAETFAAALDEAHRYDPAGGSPDVWLYGIARRLLTLLQRRGPVEDRARRRLGLAALAPGERFLDELEEELVEAARFRASRRRHAIRVPPRALGAAAAIALVGLVAALALGRDGGDERAAHERRTTPPSSFVVPLVPMLEPVSCRGLDVRGESAFEAAAELGLLTHGRRQRDALEGDASSGLPVRTFDRAETRLADHRRLRTRLHVVPSLGVSADGSCESDDGPGVCLVGPGGRFRCFPIAEVRAGHAFARAPGGLIVGIVPDGVGRVYLSAGGRTVSARVFDNVYEAKLDVPAGADVRVEIARPGAEGCARSVSSELLESVAALRQPPEEGRPAPEAAIEAVREQWRTSIDAVVEDGARFWGNDGGVDFWTVPVVRLGSRRCAPANRVCVVAVSPGTPTGAACFLHPRRGRDSRVSPQLSDNAVIHGTVPDGVTGARVTVGKLTAEVDARDNVIGGVLPFPYEDGVQVDLIRRPQPAPPLVGVVDATGIPGVAANVLAQIRRSGYSTLHAITPGIEAQLRTDVYWRPKRATRHEAELVAQLLRVPRVQRIGERRRVPRPVLEAEAAIVVVVGSAP